MKAKSSATIERKSDLYAVSLIRLYGPERDRGNKNKEEMGIMQ